MSDAVRLMKQNRTRGGALRKSKPNWSLQLGETLFAETKCFYECVFMSDRRAAVFPFVRLPD